MLADKEKAIAREIQQNVEKHIKWNEGFVDKTRAPLTPVSEKGFGGSDFRQAMPTTEYLPTPPASSSEEPSHEIVADLGSHSHPHPFRYATPPAEDHEQVMPSFRRRVGRGGRLMFDRRMPLRTKEPTLDDTVTDRFRYDSDDEDDEEVIEIDPNDISIMIHKSYLFAKSNIPPDQARRQLEANAGAHHAAGPSNGAPQPVAQPTG